MIKVGIEPYLECSSKGDHRFSAFYARLGIYGNKSIEEIYQASKIFEDGSTGLSIKEAKGRKAINQENCTIFYSYLWDLYFKENPDLLNFILNFNGFSDIYGKEGHCCQAIEIFRIRNEYIFDKFWRD